MLDSHSIDLHLFLFILINKALFTSNLKCCQPHINIELKASHDPHDNLPTLGKYSSTILLSCPGVGGFSISAVFKNLWRELRFIWSLKKTSFVANKQNTTIWAEQKNLLWIKEANTLISAKGFVCLGFEPV